MAEIRNIYKHLADEIEKQHGRGLRSKFVEKFVDLLAVILNVQTHCKMNWEFKRIYIFSSLISTVL